MDSETGLGSVLGVIGDVGKSYFNSEAESKKAKTAAQQQASSQALSVNAQKTLWVSIFVVVGLIVVAILFRGKR